MQYNHIFGPVPSRRLGVSLGVDLVTHKICSLDCIYCECGKTTRLTLNPDEYVKFEVVVAELEHYWLNNDDPDYITFSGSGEPTLNSRLGEVIEYIKQKKPHIKVAVLTNSTLLWDNAVRQALVAADLVVPSLDAISKKAFIQMNRPGRDLDIQKILNGLVIFSNDYKGKIWLEILILPGINDSQTELGLLKDAIKKIQPDLVQINTLDRPGTLSDIVPASKSELERVKKLLDFPHIEIIAKVEKSITAGVKRDDVRTAIIETIHRRPCTKEDLLKILKVEKQVLDTHIIELEKEHKIVGRKEKRGIFYQTLKDEHQ